MYFKYIVINRTHLQCIDEAANLLSIAFPHCYKDNSKKEILECLNSENVSIGAIHNDKLIGFISARPQYANTAWELHPLVVDANFRGKKVGTNLIENLEKQLVLKGCITVFLGTDDEFFKTSLSESDLYIDTYTKIQNIKNYKNHPYEFYSKCGYKIVGVIPDANGMNKPDIFMAKRISDL